MRSRISWCAAEEVLGFALAFGLMWQGLVWLGWAVRSGETAAVLRKNLHVRDTPMQTLPKEHAMEQTSEATS